MADSVLENSANTEVATPSEVEPNTNANANTDVNADANTNANSNATEGTDATEGSATEVGKEPQSAEENAKFASIRRKAEAEAKEKYDKQLAEINAQFKRQFGNFKIPGTDQAIETYADYLKAVEIQQQEAREEELRSKGIDPKIIDEMINNSPSMIRANEIIKEQEERNVNARLAEDFKKVQLLNPNLKDISELAKEPNYTEVVKYCNAGLSLVDAYKLVNFDTIANAKAEAIKQATINQAKSTAHLQTTTGINTAIDNLADIPTSQLQMWRNAYPGLSMEQLKAKYNANM